MQAVDGLRSTFWASKFEPAEPVTLTVDLGSPQSLTEIVLDWEFPAKSFSIATSGDGSTWKVVSSTDANVLLRSSVAVSGVVASKVRITMTETSPDTGFFKGKALYGLVDVAIFGAGLTPIVEECTKAASTSDARDKYFLASVSEIDPSVLVAASSEQTALEAAEAALSSAVVALQESLSSCFPPSSALLKQMAHAETHSSRSRGVFGGDRASELLSKARRTIIAARQKTR